MGRAAMCQHRNVPDDPPASAIELRQRRIQEDPVDRFEPNLRIPGPTALPPSVRGAGAHQMINHRGP